jgi:hypothetical protein
MRSLVVVTCAIAIACERAPRDFVLAQVDSPAPPGSRFPMLAADSSGRAVLTWNVLGADSIPAVRYAIRDATLHWNAPATLARESVVLVNWADVAGVVPLDDGRLIGHWLQRGTDRGSYNLLVAQSVTQDLWSAPVVPHDRAQRGEHGFASVVTMPGHLAGIQFLDGSANADGTMALRHVTLDAGTRTISSVILDATVCECCPTSAAIASLGPVVVYRGRTSDNVRDIRIVRFVDGAWRQPSAVHDDDWRIEACPVNGATVAADGDRVAVAWFTAARDTARVRIAFSRDGGGSFARAIDVDSGPAAIGRVAVALLPGSHALAVWLHRRSESIAEVAIAAVHPDSGVTWRGTLGTTDAGRASGFPRAVRAGRSVFIAWTETGRTTRVRLLSVTPRW